MEFGGTERSGAVGIARKRAWAGDFGNGCLAGGASEGIPNALERRDGGGSIGFVGTFAMRGFTRHIYGFTFLMRDFTGNI